MIDSNSVVSKLHDLLVNEDVNIILNASVSSISTEAQRVKTPSGDCTFVNILQVHSWDCCSFGNT